MSLRRTHLHLTLRGRTLPSVAWIPGSPCPSRDDPIEAVSVPHKWARSKGDGRSGGRGREHVLSSH